MTEKRLRKLLVRWQRRLGLEGWDVEMQVVGDLDAHTRMRINRHAAYQRGVIQVASHLLEGGPAAPAEYHDVRMGDERLEVTLVHELLHLWTGRIADPVEDDLDGMVHRDALALFVEGLARQEEFVVDTLARALVRAFKRAA